MKKIALALIVALVLGLAATALAAGPATMPQPRPRPAAEVRGELVATAQARERAMQDALGLTLRLNQLNQELKAAQAREAAAKKSKE